MPKKEDYRYTEDSRFYSIGEGRHYVGVTSILSKVGVSNPFLENWKMEQASQVGELGQRVNLVMAQIRGTNVHGAIAQYNIISKDGLLDGSIKWRGERSFSDDEWTRVVTYDRWFKERKPEILETEFTESATRVVSHKYKYAGTVDCLMKIDGKVYIVDFKTGKDIYDKNKLQAAAYVQAWTETYPDIPVDGAMMLALATRTKRKWKEVFLVGKDLNYYWEGFKIHLDMYHWDNKGTVDSPSRELLPTSVSPND